MKRMMIILIAGLALMPMGSIWAQTLDEETTTPATQEKTTTTGAVTASAAAAPTGATPMTETASGRVTMSGGTTLTIVTDTGTQMSFSVASSSEVPGGLKPDDMVHVVYERQADGSLRVVNVMPVSAGKETSYPSDVSEEGTLPQTGSMLPILGVLGIVAVFAGLVMRTFSRRERNV